MTVTTLQSTLDMVGPKWSFENGKGKGPKTILWLLKSTQK